MDPTLLARIQFAMTVMFHFLFPTITVYTRFRGRVSLEHAASY